MALTGKQEAFAIAYVETGNATEAYRRAYTVSEKTKPESVWSNASRLMADVKVSARIADLQKAAQERLMVTVESITGELEAARLLAEMEKQPSAMTAASMGKAKLHGLLVDRQETKHDLADPIKQLMDHVAENGKRLGSRPK